MLQSPTSRFHYIFIFQMKVSKFVKCSTPMNVVVKHQFASVLCLKFLRNLSTLWEITLLLALPNEGLPHEEPTIEMWKIWNTNLIKKTRQRDPPNILALLFGVHIKSPIIKHYILPFPPPHPYILRRFLSNLQIQIKYSYSHYLANLPILFQSLSKYLAKYSHSQYI